MDLTTTHEGLRAAQESKRQCTGGCVGGTPASSPKNSAPTPEPKSYDAKRHGLYDLQPAYLP